MKSKFIFTTGASVVALASTALGQTSGAIQQVDNVQQQRNLAQSAKSYQDGDSAPELYPDETTDVGPQTVLKVKPRHTLFEAMADAQYFYTDNVFLTENHRHDADVLVSTAEFALAPTAYDFGGGKLAPRVGYEHQWFDFGLAHDHRVEVYNYHLGGTEFAHLNLFDFNSQTAFTDAQWTKDNWVVEAGFDFRRLLSTSDYDEFYKEYVPRWDVQRLLPLCEHAALIVGYTGDYRFGDPKPVIFGPFGGTSTRLNPDLGDRTDQALFINYNQILCSHAVLQPYYQVRYTHFTDSAIGTRNDLLSSVGAALYLTICPHFEIRTFVDYNTRFSDNRFVSEYHQFDGGGGVNVTVRF